MTNDDKRIEEIEKIMSLEDAKKNERKGQEYNNLISSFTKNNQIVYPEYYAGAYINEEQELVVCDCASESNRLYYSRKCGSDDIKVELKKFSYVYLKSILEIINNAILLDQPSEMISNIHSISILEKENKIKVALKQNTSERQNEFYENIIFSEAIKFVEEKTKHTEDAIGPGGEIGGGSGAYRARNSNGHEGFVTSAHTTTLNNTITGPTGQTLGTVTERVYGGSADASFVTSNGNYTLTNQFQNSPINLSSQSTNYWVSNLTTRQKFSSISRINYPSWVY